MICPQWLKVIKIKRQLNCALLSKIFQKHIHSKNEISVVVEKVNAMPGQGVTSMFNFGQSFGAIKGICAALELPIFCNSFKMEKTL